MSPRSDFKPESSTSALCPDSTQALIEELRHLHAHGTRLGRIDLSRLDRLLEHNPEDMTATAEAGMTVREFQRQAGKFRQWLPIDPPSADYSIEEILAFDLSGPRRHGFGTIRDHLIGIEAAIPEGKLIHGGGKVVKNVAGYDLCRLFVGSRRSLGIITSATFRLRPVPETEFFFHRRSPSWEELSQWISSIQESELTPSVLDVFRLEATGPLTLVLGFSGTADEVAWLRGESGRLGFQESGTLEYDAWRDRATRILRRISVPAARVIESARSLGNVPFVARAGVGILYADGIEAAKSIQAPALAARLKSAFDPNNILPDWTA